MQYLFKILKLVEQKPLPEQTDITPTFTAVTEGGVLLTDCGLSSHTDYSDMTIERNSPYLTNWDLGEFEQTRDWTVGITVTFVERRVISICEQIANNNHLEKRYCLSMVNTFPVAVQYSYNISNCLDYFVRTDCGTENPVSGTKTHSEDSPYNIQAWLWQQKVT